MTRILRPEEANGHDLADDDDDDKDARILRALERIEDRQTSFDERLGHSPDHALGSPGSGLCKVVADLKSESDYQARRRLEKDQRAERWKSRLQTAYSLVGAVSILCAAGWGLFKLLLTFSK